MRRKVVGSMIVVVAMVSCLTLVTGAYAETWRFAHKMAPDGIEGRAHQRFADKVAEYSGGKLTVRVYPMSQLGDAPALLEQLQAGTLQVYSEQVATLQKWVPSMQLMAAPFFYSDWGHYKRFMNSSYVDGWLKEVRQKAGVMTLGDGTEFLRGPYRVMVSKKSVRSLAGLHGLKLRIHNDPLNAAAWSHLGAQVLIMGWADVYLSLSRGLIEAVNSPLDNVESMKFHEAAKYVIRHDEYPASLGYFVNIKAYDALSADLKQAVKRAYQDAAAYGTSVIINYAEESIARLKSKGVTYNEIDKREFIPRMKEFYDKRSSSGEIPKALLDEVEKTRKAP